MDEQKDDKILFPKLNKKGSSLKRIIFKPSNDINYNYLNWYKREELMDLARENFNIYRRLNAKNSYYTLNSHLRDYKKAQYYKKNYCKYPSIDFYRTSKCSSSCSIFNYCTFNNYNNINNEFINEFNNKKNIKIKTKNRSSENIDKLHTYNIERQKKIDAMVNTHYQLKDYYEEKKRNEEIEYRIKNEEEENQENQDDDDEKQKQKIQENQENQKIVDNYNINQEIKNNINDNNSEKNTNNSKKNSNEENNEDKNITDSKNNNFSKEKKSDIIKKEVDNNNKSKNEYNEKENKKTEEEKEKEEDLPLLEEILVYGKDEEIKINSNIKRNSLKDDDDVIIDFNSSKNNNNTSKKEEYNKIKSDDDNIISDIMEEF